MKKFYSASCIYGLILLLILCLETNAQGIYQMWGTTNCGGPDDWGTLFSTRYDGTGHSVKKFFTTINPGRPGEANKPVMYNNKFYSILREGGLNNDGIISEYDPATGVYTKRADLFTVGGTESESSLVVYNNKLYGLTYRGGAHYYGILFEFNPANGSIIKRHDFESATGMGPLGDLVVFNDKLYGIAGWGGANDNGVIFEFDPATNIYTSKKHFAEETSGKSTSGTLIVYNNLLWGVSTYSKGPETGGYIFSYNPATNTLLPKVELGSINASMHYGSMTILNNKFYGAASQGGANNLGVLFQYDPATNQLTKEMDFTNATPNNRFTMITYNNLLYGASMFGGAGNDGVLFSYNPATNQYSEKAEFANALGGSSTGRLTVYNNKMYGLLANGGLYGSGGIFEYNPANNAIGLEVNLGGSGAYRPIGLPLYYNNKLYGAASDGGNNGEGVIYSYNLVTQTYTVEHHMEKSQGQFSDQGGFTLYNNKFYGVTVIGGINGVGTIFEFDPATKVYTKRHDFTGANGANPAGNLLVYGNKMYGTCAYGGGATDNGTIFEFDPATNKFANRVVFDSTRGRYPYAGLILYNGRIFGVAGTGGAYNQGTLFEYLPQPNGLLKLADFESSATGKYPRGKLVGYNNKLYGLTFDGEQTYWGKLYEFDIATGILTGKAQLNNEQGRYAISGMTLLNNKMYGMTNIGGVFAVGGVLFEYNPGTNQYTKRVEFTSHNGRLPRNSELVAVPAPVAPGSANSCINTQTVNIVAANANEWIPFTDAEGRAVAEINANGNVLGNTIVRLYVNTGNTRKDNNGRFYLDRNITITSANQPSTPVSVRLYIRKKEFDDLKATAGSEVAAPVDLGLFKNSDFCSGTVESATTKLVSTFQTWGIDYVYTAQVNSFSSFYFASNNHAALPVHILSFKGTPMPASNKLEWKASCTDGVNFTLERSIDGLNYSSIYLIMAELQDCNKPFIFNDVNIAEPRYYYRLHMKENNGAESYSPIVIIERERNTLNSLQVAPNPVTGPEARIKLIVAKSANAKLSIVDLGGRIVGSKQVTVTAGINTLSFHVSGLAAGKYTIIYNDGKTQLATTFVK